MAARRVPGRSSPITISGVMTRPSSSVIGFTLHQFAAQRTKGDAEGICLFRQEGLARLLFKEVTVGIGAAVQHREGA